MRILGSDGGFVMVLSGFSYFYPQHPTAAYVGFQAPPRCRSTTAERTADQRPASANACACSFARSTASSFFVAGGAQQGSSPASAGAVLLMASLHVVPRGTWCVTWCVMHDGGASRAASVCSSFGRGSFGRSVASFDRSCGWVVVVVVPFRSLLLLFESHLPLLLA